MKSFEKGQFHQVDLEQHEFEGRTELQIIKSLANIQDYHQNIAHSVLAASDGELDQAFRPQGKEDRLGHTVKQMLGSLSGISQQANVIASGNYTAEITPRSDKDELGIALLAMTKTLQSVAVVAEAVADGNLDVEVESKGAEDLLAKSMNRMTATLKDAARQANVIATGDYTAEISPRSDKDELGIALLAMTKMLQSVALAAEAVADGNLDVEVESRGAEDLLAKSMNRMTAVLNAAREKSAAEEWLKAGIARLNDVMRGEMAVSTISQGIVTQLAEYLDARIGALFITGEDRHLELAGRYAYASSEGVPDSFALGEGLVGQAAVDGKIALIKDVPADYIAVSSSLGKTAPRNIVVLPFLFENQVIGVIELGTLDAFSDLQMELLNQVAESIAIAVNAARSAAQQQTLLEQTQSQAEELQVQQEELKASNEELEEQTQLLTDSEARLKVQQEELQVTNEELEEKHELLQRQKEETERARREIEEKAEDLALASKYKSEFLTNMSHELRTPLNSLLLLARSLSENREENLSTDQVECAGVIYQSGNDLLSLINEILDLSQIEAGRMVLRFGEVSVSDLVSSVEAVFGHLAADKGLALKVSVDEDAPAHITSDRKRVEQVIKNLVSNSIKFTEKGSIKVTFGPASLDADLRRSGLEPKRTLAIAVEDTGIGIAAEQQKVIFEAFQQVDGSVAREYGGTGLGLSISRELVKLLGGEIQLSSGQGGSTFTVFIPVEEPANEAVPRAPRPLPVETDAHRSQDRAPAQVASIPDDRERIDKGDRTILLVEDDPQFARIMAKKCHERGFKCLATATGEDGLDLARRFVPQGVILDIKLPGMDGWAVLTALKEGNHTRHIPVHIVSVEEASTQALRKGAVGHTVKPLDPEDLEETFRRLEQMSPGKPKRVLVVEDDAETRRRAVELVGNGDVTVDEASTGEQAIKAIRATRYDCMILDLGLPDMDGSELLEKLESEEVEIPPVIIHTARSLTWEEDQDLRKFSDSIVIKDVRSDERLLDEVSLFLHRVVAKMPEKKRQVITSLHDSDAVLRDKKVLLVDDDMRTLFALSKILADRGMRILKAKNGQKALEELEQEPDVDIVLMDIMMPVLDGYETMKQIRSQERFKRLPIIALTAKAMKGDHERCVEAGASDYLPKPVDQDRLVSMMRVWLYR